MRKTRAGEHDGAAKTAGNECIAGGTQTAVSDGFKQQMTHRQGRLREREQSVEAERMRERAGCEAGCAKQRDLEFESVASLNTIGQVLDSSTQ